MGTEAKGNGEEYERSYLGKCAIKYVTISNDYNSKLTSLTVEAECSPRLYYFPYYLDIHLFCSILHTFGVSFNFRFHFRVLFDPR